MLRIIPHCLSASADVLALHPSHSRAKNKIWKVSFVLKSWGPQSPTELWHTHGRCQPPRKFNIFWTLFHWLPQTFVNIVGTIKKRYKNIFCPSLLFVCEHSSNVWQTNNIDIIWTFIGTFHKQWINIDFRLKFKVEPKIRNKFNKKKYFVIR